MGYGGGTAGTWESMRVYQEINRRIIGQFVTHQPNILSVFSLIDHTWEM